MWFSLVLVLVLTTKDAATNWRVYAVSVLSFGWLVVVLCNDWGGAEMRSMFGRAGAVLLVFVIEQMDTQSASFEQVALIAAAATVSLVIFFIWVSYGEVRHRTRARR